LLATARRQSTLRQADPHTGGLRDQLNPEQTTPTRESGGLSNGDSPPFPVPFDMPVDVRWPESPHVRQSGLGIEAILVAPVAWQLIKGRRRYPELARRAVLNRRW